MRRTGPSLTTVVAMSLFASAASGNPAPAAPAAGTSSTARVPPPPPPPSDQTAGVAFDPRFVLDTGRVPTTPPDADTARLQFHGEYQVRATALTDPRLESRTGGFDSLGQTSRLYQWLRITPRFDYAASVSVIAQADVPRGFMLGQQTHDVDAADVNYSERQPFQADPRWLYVEWRTPIGALDAGQQPFHYGMGIVANDGDHPELFGDLFGGDRVERVSFAPRAKIHGGEIRGLIAGDLVFVDDRADLRDGDRAYQAVAALEYERVGGDAIGIEGTYRRQRRPVSDSAGNFDERYDTLTLDTSGQFNAKLPGARGHVFGQYEVAYVLGKTNATRSPVQAATGADSVIDAVGAAARLGAVLTGGTAERRWGRVVLTAEWGWASGDANPGDGKARAFTFDRNHNVGLILFDEILAWKTARAATLARSPAFGGPTMPGARWTATNGGVSGATYLNPTLVVRPVPELDLLAGMLIAQTTADWVDPLRLETHGTYQNYDGGTATSHDLGLELDAGIGYRLPLGLGPMFQVGAQTGVLFPGHAFDTASGGGLGTQYLAVGRVGFQY